MLQCYSMLPTSEQSAKWSEADWQQWANEKAKAQFKKRVLAVFQWIRKQWKARLAQFVAVWALVVVCSKGPVKTALVAVQQSVGEEWAQFVMAVKAVAFLEAVRLGKALVEGARSLQASVSAIETTSQVCATRANMDEWRQCLQFAAQWHKCCLQTAYKIWQSGRIAAPAPPANQWGVLPGGQPMQVTDQLEADAELPAQLEQFMDLDGHLSAVHEKFMMMEAAKKQYTAEEVKEIKKVEPVYQQFKAKCLQISGKDWRHELRSLKEVADEVSQGMDFNAPVFK